LNIPSSQPTLIAAYGISPKAALKGEKSIVEIRAENNIPRTNAIDLRDKLLNEAEFLFIPAHEKEKQTRQLKQEMESVRHESADLLVACTCYRKSADPAHFVSSFGHIVVMQ
jgi:hypothetical protein